MHSLKLGLILSALVLASCQHSRPEDTLYQVSTAHALSKGHYDGITTYKDIQAQGNFGIGTYHKVNGEMVAVDGQFFQISSDGTVQKTRPEQVAPYATVHKFSSNKTVELGSSQDYADLRQQLSTHIENKEQIYGIKIKAVCKRITLRAPKAQSKPYPPLADVIATQSIFEHENISGTLVGYYVPKYFGNIIIPGYHLHFISDHHTVGGHVLDLALMDGRLDLDPIHKITVSQ